MTNLKLCAEQVFRQMGLGWKRENIEQDSILAVTLQNPMVCEQRGILGNIFKKSPKYQFNEHYFYHEFMFFLLSAVELEAQFNFISKTKLLCEIDLGPQPFNAQAILNEMQNYSLLIPTTRMKEIGITPKFPTQQFENCWIGQLTTLKQLQYEAVQTGIRGVPDPENWQVGLTPRTTAYHRYLGALSDAMVEAVGGRDDVMFVTAFETAILVKRSLMFGVVQQVLVEGLAQFGVRHELN